MADNNLTTLATLLSGNNSGNALAFDPTFAQAVPDLQLARTIQQQGMSAAPALPAQAVSRLAQALTGAFIEHQATSNLARATSGTAEDMAKTLEKVDPNNPLIAGLRSDNAVTRANSETFPKTMALLSSPVDLARGAQRRTGVSENTNPLSDSGALAADGSRVTQRPVSPLGAALAKSKVEAAGAAPYRPAGNGVFQGPNGPVEMPITEETLHNNQPQVRPATLSKPTSPASALPLPPPRGSQSALPAPGSNMLPKTTISSPARTDSSASGPDANSPQGGIGPSPSNGPANQAPTSGAPAAIGKPLPNAAIEPAVKADTEELSKDREAATKGQQEMATIRAIQDFAPRVKTGWSADTKLEGARILKDMGVSDDKIGEFMKTDVAAGQILQKKFVELSAAAARNMGAREPGSVIQMFAKASTPDRNKSSAGACATSIPWGPPGRSGDLRAPARQGRLVAHGPSQGASQEAQEFRETHPARSRGRAVANPGRRPDVSRDRLRQAIYGQRLRELVP
jgi:hypothetical protein